MNDNQKPDNNLLKEMTVTRRTEKFLNFLEDNPSIRERIGAAPDRTMIFCGHFEKEIWAEYEGLRRRFSFLANFKLLHEILKSIEIAHANYSDLYSWIKAIGNEAPEKENSFLAWSAVSKIMCSNARGKVSFLIGDGVNPVNKVFAKVELETLINNQNLHPNSYDMLRYCNDRLQNEREDVRVVFIDVD